MLNNPIQKIIGIAELTQNNDCNTLQLKVNGIVQMSNHKIEIDLHKTFFEKVKGNILVGGLGLGVIFSHIYFKTNKITVLEKYKDVIDLIKPYYKTLTKIEIINTDVFTFKTSEKYDTIWIDIFIDFPTEKEIIQIKEIYQPLLNKDGWLGIWTKHGTFTIL